MEDFLCILKEIPTIYIITYIYQHLLREINLRFGKKLILFILIYILMEMKQSLWQRLYSCKKNNYLMTRNYTCIIIIINIPQITFLSLSLLKFTSRDEYMKSRIYLWMYLYSICRHVQRANVYVYRDIKHIRSVAKFLREIYRTLYMYNKANVYRICTASVREKSILSLSFSLFGDAGQLHRIIYV